MSRNFNLASLIPERHTFTDENGEQYGCRSFSEFSAEDIVQFEQLYRRFRDRGKSSKRSSIEQQAQGLDDAVNQLVGMIVPDLPRERVAAIPFMLKMRFFHWWDKQTESEKSWDENDEGGEAEIIETPLGEAEAN